MLPTIHCSMCCSNTYVLAILHDYRFYVGTIGGLFTFYLSHNTLYHYMVVPTIWSILEGIETSKNQ